MANASIPLSALPLKVRSPLESFQGALSLKNLAGEQQLQGLQLEQAKLAQQQGQQLSGAIKGATAVGPDGQTTLSLDSLAGSLGAAGLPQAVDFAVAAGKQRNDQAEFEAKRDKWVTEKLQAEFKGREDELDIRHKGLTEAKQRFVLAGASEPAWQQFIAQQDSLDPAVKEWTGNILSEMGTEYNQQAIQKRVVLMQKLETQIGQAYTALQIDAAGARSAATDARFGEQTRVNEAQRAVQVYKGQQEELDKVTKTDNEILNAVSNAAPVISIINSDGSYKIAQQLPDGSYSEGTSAPSIDDALLRRSLVKINDILSTVSLPEVKSIAGGIGIIGDVKTAVERWKSGTAISDQERANIVRVIRSGYGFAEESRRKKIDAANETYQTLLTDPSAARLGDKLGASANVDAIMRPRGAAAKSSPAAAAPELDFSPDEVLNLFVGDDRGTLTVADYEGMAKALKKRGAPVTREDMADALDKLLTKRAGAKP